VVQRRGEVQEDRVLNNPWTEKALFAFYVEADRYAS
jgi:hypothetical protein